MGYVFVNLEPGTSERAAYVRAGDVVALITEDGSTTTAVLASGERVTGGRPFSQVLAVLSEALFADDGA